MYYILGILILTSAFKYPVCSYQKNQFSLFSDSNCVTTCHAIVILHISYDVKKVIRTFFFVLYCS